MKKQLSHNDPYNLIYNINKSPLPRGMNLTSQKLNQTPQHRPTPELDRENLDSLDWDSISSGSNSSVDEAPPFTREESLLKAEQEKAKILGISDSQILSVSAPQLAEITNVPAPQTGRRRSPSSLAVRRSVNRPKNIRKK